MVINRNGETLFFLPKHNAIWLFFEGLCLVGVGKKRGFIDRTGEWAIEPTYDYASPFSQGLAPVSIDGQWGFIDKTGEVVIKMKRGHNGRSFYDGLAGVRKNDQWGFIDQTGRWVIKPSYRKIDRFSEGVCSVMC